MTTTNLSQKLLQVQSKLKAEKGQFNKFGNYKYRSLEDINESVKPLLAEHGLTLFISDELVLIGERYYIKATVKITDGTSDYSVDGYAREAESMKGQSESQITGTASSYARKYAMNGMFLIDDTKDDDSNENHEERNARANQSNNQNNQNRGNVQQQRVPADHLKKLDNAFNKIAQFKKTSGNAIKNQLLAFYKYEGKYEDIPLNLYNNLVEACKQEIDKLQANAPQTPTNENEEPQNANQEDTFEWGQR
jgi:hypothetical protein